MRYRYHLGDGILKTVCITVAFFKKLVMHSLKKNIMRGMHVNPDYSDLCINTNFFCVFLFCLIHVRVSIIVYAYGEAAI